MELHMHNKNLRKTRRNIFLGYRDNPGAALYLNLPDPLPFQCGFNHRWAKDSSRGGQGF